MHSLNPVGCRQWRRNRRGRRFQKQDKGAGLHPSVRPVTVGVPGSRRALAALHGCKLHLPVAPLQTQNSRLDLSAAAGQIIQCRVFLLGRWKTQRTSKLKFFMKMLCHFRWCCLTTVWTHLFVHKPMRVSGDVVPPTLRPLPVIQPQPAAVLRLPTRNSMVNGVILTTHQQQLFPPLASIKTERRVKTETPIVNNSLKSINQSLV